MDDDEALSTLLAMGFPDLGEIKRALRMAKNDLNEAVAILTNESSSASTSDTYGPLPAPHSSSGSGDVEMNDAGAGDHPADEEGFPLTHFYELETRVFQDNWSIPYKKEESLGKCLIAAKKMTEEGTINSDEHCPKFLDRVLPEAFQKLMTSNATQRWQIEIQEGIYDMTELFIELIIAKLKIKDEVPCGLLNVLATAFDMKNDWNNKNRDKTSRGDWTEARSISAPASIPKTDYAPIISPVDYSRSRYGWLCDLVNQFGNSEGFHLIVSWFEKDELQAKQMASLLAPIASCAELLSKEKVRPMLSHSMEMAFKFIRNLDVTEVRGKDVTAVSDLLANLKALCLSFWPLNVEECDKQRLTIICNMLKAPQFNSKMNALKEVSRLIDECRSKSKKNISTDKVVDWMAENSVLSVALEGNIDQIQYTDRIKAIVEFLGPQLSKEDISKIWKLQESANVYVAENIYAIMATAATKLSISQLEHLTKLIRETWESSNDRVREKLLVLIGQIGKEVCQAAPVKGTPAILALLWEVSHSNQLLPKHLVERGLSEHLSILSEVNVNKDALKKTYVLKCVDDIKQCNRNIVPSIKHLHDICKSYSKGTTIYQKPDKATLAELNKQHEVVRLLSSSLKTCHQMSVSVAEDAGMKLQKDTLFDERYTHEEVVDVHLELMKFFLKDGDLYLSWSRCIELWATLIDNPKAIAEDRDKIFDWFRECLTDLESSTQLNLFETKLLHLDPDVISEKAFACFKSYFESINITNGSLKKSLSNFTVERKDLVGLEYIWHIITHTLSEKIANLAITYLLNLSYTFVNVKLKVKSDKLHQQFISNCYSRLRSILNCPNSEEGKQEESAVEEGHEIETSMSENPASLVAISISNVSSMPPNIIGQRLKHATRILTLAERYISTIEEAFSAKRTILPHAANFQGRRITIKILTDNKKDEFSVEAHVNELLADVKAKVAENMRQSVDRLNIHCGDVELNASKDNCLIGSLGNTDNLSFRVKTQNVAFSSSTALVLFQDDKDNLSDRSSPTSGDETARSKLEEEERSLPGVVMASGGQVFSMLYHLASLNDSQTTQATRRLIRLIPTDPAVEEVMDAISYHYSSSVPVAAADASPKLSPRSKKVEHTLTNFSDAKDKLARLFDSNAEGMNAFRVLYNLEVLSGRIMPTKSNSYHTNLAPEFATNFLNAGGLKLIFGVMEKASIPADVDYEVRQSAYLIALQLAEYLLCGEASKCKPFKPITSPVIKPTPPKRSALDSSISMCASPVIMSATRTIQCMTESDFSGILSCLMRVVWASAAGNLQLASSELQSMKKTELPRFQLGRRSRDSSTGSSSSEGSSAEPTALHAGVCAQQAEISSGDCQIAAEAFELMITCLQMRTSHTTLFYKLPLLKEFIIDTLLGSSSQEVRQSACDQLIRLSKVKITARSLNLDGCGPASPLPPRQFLTKLLLKTPVPLWIPSCTTRGISHNMIARSSEYFELRCSLLKGMNKKEQEALDVSAEVMIEDEMTFLQNFASCPNPLDCILIAGHLKLVEALLTCTGVDKRQIGQKLIKDILNSFLFPAPQLMIEGALSKSRVDMAKDVNPMCDTSQSRIAAYNLLVELARNCSENVSLISSELIKMHHYFNENLLKEFEYSPAIERRGESKFVGLKNAGATCYMNSVLQQLFCVPGICDMILAANTDSTDEETIFYQLQNVFGHLLESKLKYYEPEKFWNCFRLFGQPVNVREQQDAFEFFTQIVDQTDEHLSKLLKSKIFSTKFEGVFSDQKICQGCPHRYEREQTFMALNLTVKTNNLQESLDQFVKGELLDGDNAYYCEKCKAKRNAIKRMCIRTLPPTLMIQLKRFHYDWETNRSLKFDDYFQFPWTLDMTPYTTEGIKVKEEGKKALKLESNANKYDLVGIVVHSGQANAGHYYSYIKDRRARSSINNVNRKSKWYKFNDTTIEEFDMNDETLTTECFGGTYKVKKENSNSSLPENRQRYWNAYMLVYEAPPSKTKRLSTTMRKSLSSSSRKLSGGLTRASEPPAARESLSQLSDLLEKGEKKGIFTSRMPASIERGIQEENLKFLENRDVFCEEYYKFIHEFLTCNIHVNPRNKSVNISSICKDSVKLTVNFLCNSYFHLRHRQSAFMRDLNDVIASLIEKSLEATEWLLEFLATDGLKYLKPFLLECTFREVRASFAMLLDNAFKYYEKHHNGDTYNDYVNKILSGLVDLMENDVANNSKCSGQFFLILSKFSQMGVQQSQQLFDMNVFSQLTSFLLGVKSEPVQDFDPKKHRRRWTSLQTKEFSELFSAISHLILSCNMTDFQDGVSSCQGNRCLPPRLVFTSETLCSMPEQVSRILHGPVAPVFVRDMISACREVQVGVDIMNSMLINVAYCNARFSQLVMEEVMQQYNTVNSGELKNLSVLLVDLLSLDDHIQNDRIKFAIEGDNSRNIEGLLMMVKNNQNTDSCRAYQCIKTVAHASNKSALVKEYLLRDPARWQWSVNWLKSKMSDHAVGGGNWSPSTGSDHGSAHSGSISILSNEDSSTKTFQRTTSAQVTLEEANAILAEFGVTEMPITSEISMETEEEQIQIGDQDDIEKTDDEMPDLQKLI